MESKKIIVAMTGASGSIYGFTLCKELLKAGKCIALTISAAGFDVIRYETGSDWQGDGPTVEKRLRQHFRVDDSQLAYYAGDNLLAPMASGSAVPDAMVICPCSMGTLARIASGVSSSLLERTADVIIKERCQLIVVPRETPLNEIHLENMLKLARMGVCILPAMPAFYHKPESVDDLVDFVVGKILDSLGIENSLFTRWGGV